MQERSFDSSTDAVASRPAPRLRLLAIVLALAAVAGLVVAAVAVAGDPSSRSTAGDQSSAGRSADSSTTSSSSTSSSTSTSAPSGGGGGQTETGGSNGGKGPQGIGPRLRTPQAPIVLPVGVDMGSFSIANVGDAPLHLLHLDHPGILGTGHEDPVPEVLAAGATIEINFALFAPNLNDFTPGPWQRVIKIESDGGDAEILVKGTAPVPGDLSVPVAVPPVPYPQGQAFWVEQAGGAPTTVEITVDPGLTLNGDGDFTMGVGAKAFVGVKPCGRPAAAVDKTMMRKVYFHVAGHGTHEVQVNWVIEAGPAVPCATQTI